jgi:hypothetical protein
MNAVPHCKRVNAQRDWPIKKAAAAAFLIEARPLCSGFTRVFLTEFLHATGGVDNFLLARIKGVAGGTNFYMQGFAQR